jgi:hypothetical protein
VPQGVLIKHVFHNNSWSWGAITHLCHRLHNIPVRSFFPPHCDPSPPRDRSSSASPPSS